MQRTTFESHLGTIPLSVLASLAVVAVTASPTSAAEATAPTSQITVYKTTTCGCCAKWVDYLRQNGFEVTVHSVDHLGPVKSRLGVPEPLQTCHTAEIDGYVIEGHVPADDIRRLLDERPEATGIAVPGMPIGAPGMEYKDEKEPYEVILFGPDDEEVFASH